VTDNTNAERQRRYIAKLKAAAQGKDGVTNAKLRDEIDDLKRQLAEVRSKRPDRHQSTVTNAPVTNATLDARIIELEGQLAHMRFDYHALHAAYTRALDKHRGS